MSKKSDRAIEQDIMTREAMMYAFDVMDDMTDGSLKRGWRSASVAERITEWDALTPEQIQMLVDKKGEDWVARKGAEIDKLRKEVL